MKKLAIMTTAGVLAASHAIGQDTEGSDLISGILGVLTAGNSGALGSDAVERYVEFGYGQADVKSWDITDASGMNYSGEDAEGDIFRLGYRVVGASRGGQMATYGYGLEYFTSGDDATQFETRTLGIYGNAGIGYVTDFGMDVSGSLTAGFGIGEARFGTTEVKGAPVALGLEVGLGYSYDDFRAYAGYRRKHYSTGALGRIGSSAVTEEYSFDTSEIFASIGLNF